MISALYLNLVVQDLPRAKRFFEALGWRFDPRVTNDDAGGLQISDNIFAMLHTRDSIRRFTDKPVVDSHGQVEMMAAIQLPSRAAVDALADKAIAAGGRAQRPTEDHGFMYTRPFEDLDGHIWEPFWMDPQQATP